MADLQATISSFDVKCPTCTHVGSFVSLGSTEWECPNCHNEVSVFRSVGEPLIIEHCEVGA